jgi:hypothetical protein
LALQVAELYENPITIEQNHPSVAEAPLILIWLVGTAEAEPFQNRALMGVLGTFLSPACPVFGADMRARTL